MPMALFFMISSPIGGSFIGKIEARYIIAGSTAMAAVGIYLFSWIDPRSGALDIIIPLSIMAFGMGLGMAQRTNIIASAVPQHEIGVASSILALARNIAGAFGIAIFASILSKSVQNNIIEITRNSILHLRNAADYQTVIGLMSLKAQVSAYSDIFVYSAAVMFIGAIASLFIRVDKENLNTDAEVFVE